MVTLEEFEERVREAVPKVREMGWTLQAGFLDDQKRCCCIIDAVQLATGLPRRWDGWYPETTGLSVATTQGIINGFDGYDGHDCCYMETATEEYCAGRRLGEKLRLEFGVERRV